MNKILPYQNVESETAELGIMHGEGAKDIRQREGLLSPSEVL